MQQYQKHPLDGACVKNVLIMLTSMEMEGDVMLISVRQHQPDVFILSVTGAIHCPDSVIEYDTMDKVWNAARKISEREADVKGIP